LESPNESHNIHVVTWPEAQKKDKLRLGDCRGRKAKLRVRFVHCSGTFVADVASCLVIIWVCWVAGISTWGWVVN
jgi:hypothetical protein